jgi:restriction system protein
MAADIPLYHELLWPILQAVLELGGSASIGEIVETVIKGEGLSDGQQAVLHNDGPGTELAYRLGWARTELPRVFRTGNLRLIHAASCPFRYSSMASCGVR